MRFSTRFLARDCWRAGCTRARMPCIHCGLPTDGEENHGTIEACIEALIAETMRLRKALSDRPKGEISVTTVSGHSLGKSHFAGS